MGETPEQLAEGRTGGSFIGRYITDLTGTAASSGSVPYINTDSTLAQSSAMNFNGTNSRLTVTNVGASTIVMGETDDPGNTSENIAILYATNVSGSTVLRVRFGAGAAQTIATEQ